MNYFDILLAKKLRGGGGGDITIKSLNVTQNGTYSEEGVAYSPVKVDVPLPENAYLLKEIEDVEIASFDDGSDLSMPKLEVAIEPQQDLHGYDSPWVGGAGKNILPYFTAEEKNGIRLTYDNGVVILNGTASANAFFSLTNLNLASGTYTFSANNTEVNSNVHVSLREIGATSDFTDLPINNLNKNNTYQNVSIGQITLYVLSGTQLTNFKLPLQIEVGNQATTFAPYSNICPISGWDEANVTVADDVETPTVSNVYTIDLDGTRYGGTLDVVSGVLTVDRAYLTIDDFNSYGGSGTSAGGLHWFDVKNKPEGKSGNKNICSICAYVQNGWTSTITVMSVGISATIPVRIYDSSESLSDLKNKYPNLQLVYELAIPLTIQLTPTLVKSLRGVNNVYADCGNILDLSYLAKEE